ncbi:MAG: HepT-like ribonuclease domain-containing protein [Methanoregula sp.]
MHRTALQYLDDILEAARNIGEDTQGLSYSEFTADRRRRDAVVRNFEIIGEATKKLPDELKARYPSVAWKQVAGLRDVIAHGYFHIDYEILWGIITNTLPKFKSEVTKIRKTEQQNEKESGKQK